jgi:hypothetical protein
MNPEPKVTLLTWTMNPLETVFAVWMASKDEEPLYDPLHSTMPASREEIETLFKAVIAQKIPIGEHVDFVFMLENVSVSWREQAVRHRIGVEISPERLGIDLIPNLAESSFWSQSMRIQNMGEFATNGAYRLPATIKNHENKGLATIFRKTMGDIEAAYNDMVSSGIPMEDARELIPLGAQHRISWKLNIGALQHIFAKRGCWILQLGIWGPVIRGMVDELATKVHPVFRELVRPPCLNDSDDEPYTGCVYMEECRRRLTGDDKLPPCPLHLNYEEHVETNIPMLAQMKERAEQYREFWGRDPYTGAKIK